MFVPIPTPKDVSRLAPIAEALVVLLAALDAVAVVAAVLEEVDEMLVISMRTSQSWWA